MFSRTVLTRVASHPRLAAALFLLTVMLLEMGTVGAGGAAVYHGP